MDADLAMALRISEQEQKRIEDELKREEEMLAEVLRLSLQEKWSKKKKVFLFMGNDGGNQNRNHTIDGDVAAVASLI